MAVAPSALADALHDCYLLERELGHGGMATVYLARDLKHKRPVALKVLLPELAHSLGPDRFHREIEIAARLQHPHILTVLDSGEAAGQLWFTMPYVEGESLRDRLIRQKQLPVEDALRLAREVALALDYAHQHGVIHRDIKPENILLTQDGSTLVADFGIARPLGAAGDGLTQTGMSSGTPAYMSPEQSNGEPGLDAGTDIYSLGSVLYELLAGEPPYTGATAHAIIVKRFTDPVPSVRRVRPSVPEAVDQAIQRALAPVPADRYTTAAQFAQALAAPLGSTPAEPGPGARPEARRTVPSARALVLALLVIGTATFVWLRSYSDGDAGAGPKQLAVLPFENLGNLEDEYFADGMSDAVRGKLTSLPGVQVTARSSSILYKKTGKTPQRIGQELGVQYLLTGTVRWERGSSGPSRVQVSPELIQASTASATWQQPFDAVLDNVFQVQTDIASRVAQALGLAIGAGERKTLAAPPTTNLAAYRAYLKGEEVSNGMAASDPVTLRLAIAHYEQAVALDSTFVPAWARLSQAHSLIYYIIAGTPEEREAARSAAERALTLAPERPEGRLALGEYHYRISGDYAQALEQYELGKRITPRSAELLLGIALAEQSLGRWDASLEHLRRAQVLDPLSPRPPERLARTLLWLRRYPEAVAAADRGLALDPADLSLLGDKAMVHLAQGDLAGARAVYHAASDTVEPATLVADVGNYWDLFWVLDDQQQAILLRLTPTLFGGNRGAWGLTLAGTYALKGNMVKAQAYADSGRAFFESQLRADPENASLNSLVGVALAYLGRKTEATAKGERSVALGPVSRDAYGGPYTQHQLARIYLLVGEPEKALDQLEPLLKIPYYLSPGWLRIDPTFAPLKGNPRFERLVAGK